MNVGEWIGIASIAVTVLGGGLATVRSWVRNVETELSKKLSTEAHERICAERNTRVEKQLDDLRDDMERRHEENRETFGKIETATTGTHKLIVDLYRDLLNHRGGGR